MSDLKSEIGRRSSSARFRVTEERLRLFCEAVGAPYRGEAPLTFMTVFREGELELLAAAGFELSRVLHAGQEYSYRDRILPGDELEYETVLSKALEKQGSSGTLRFLTYDTEVRALRDGAWVVVGGAKATVVVK